MRKPFTESFSIVASGVCMGAALVCGSMLAAHIFSRLLGGPGKERQ